MNVKTQKVSRVQIDTFIKPYSKQTHCKKRTRTSGSAQKMFNLDFVRLTSTFG